MRANAKIREALVSSADRADSSYTHGMWFGQRKDTPQVSPSSVSTSAKPPRSPQIAQPTRRSFLQTAQPPPNTLRESHYWPRYKTWRKYVEPEKEADVTTLPKPDEEKTTQEDLAGDDADADANSDKHS